MSIFEYDEFDDFDAVLNDCKLAQMNDEELHQYATENSVEEGYSEEGYEPTLDDLFEWQCASCGINYYENYKKYKFL